MNLIYLENNPTQWKLIETWLSSQKEIQFDIETTVTSYWCTKKLVTLQFGDLSGENKALLYYPVLGEEQINFLREYLSSWEVLKLIHAAAFEYVVCRFHNLEVNNVYCTMVAEQVLTGGVETDGFALGDLTWKYCEITLDKTLQTSFNLENPLTPEQIEYAFNDVTWLGKIKDFQDAESIKTGSTQVMWLEMRALLAFSECTYHGISLNKEEWLDNLKYVEPIIKHSEQQLVEHIEADTVLLSRAIQLGFYSVEDRITLNLNSGKQKLQMLQLLLPTCEGSSKVYLKHFIQNNFQTLNTTELTILMDVSSGNYESFTKYLVQNHRDSLIANNFLIPARTLSINWSSPIQTLELFKAIEPKLKSTKRELIEELAHPIFEAYLDFKDSTKLESTYGEAFIAKHVEPDGKVRTTYNSVVSTGRASSKSPNMQQIPAKPGSPEVEAQWEQDHPTKPKGSFYLRYRNAFKPSPGFEIVDSDYTGQELALIAFASGEPTWVNAIESGHDLHSVTAALVYKQKWTKAADPDCKYITHKQKCKCFGHKQMRNSIKSINFGLAYGMSKFKLSRNNKCSVKEAEALIYEYFNTFPGLKAVLNSFGRFGVTHGYTQTLGPFLRKRWFWEWKNFTQSDIDLHASGIEYNGRLGRIERQSKNHPIQGSGADIMKLAMWVVYKWIRDNNLQDFIRILLNVHDQLTTEKDCTLELDWNAQLDALMCKAAAIVIPTGILKAETNTSAMWTK